MPYSSRVDPIYHGESKPMMKNWRDVNTSARVSVLARQLMKSVNDDLMKLNQSQRDMLAAVAMRDRELSLKDAMQEFGGARSSIGFARTILRFSDPQMSGLVLSGLISVHVLDRLRREMSPKPLLRHLLSLNDEDIKSTYISNRGIGKKRWMHPAKTPIITTIYGDPGTGKSSTTLTPRQLAAQKAANARWAKEKETKAPVKGLPIVPLGDDLNPMAINRAIKVITTARDLAQLGDLKGARQLLAVVGTALAEA